MQSTTISAEGKMSRPRAPPPFQPAPHPPDSPNQIRNSLRYTDLYNKDTLSRTQYQPPRRPPLLIPSFSSTPEVEEPSNTDSDHNTEASVEDATKSVSHASSDKDNESNQEVNISSRKSSRHEERVKVTDQASILSIENLDALTHDPDEDYFSSDSVSVFTERAESDATQLNIQGPPNEGAKSKSSPPKVAPRPKTKPSKTERLVLPQTHGAPEVIELETITNSQMNTVANVLTEFDAPRNNDIQNNKGISRKETSLTYHKSDPGPPLKISSQEITDQEDVAKRDSRLVYHPSDPGPPPGQLRQADIDIVSNSPRLHHSSTRSTDRSNLSKPYFRSSDLSLKSSLGSRGDLSTSMRSLNRGLASSSESTLYDVQDPRELILDRFLQQEGHHLVPILDPDTTESEATDNEGLATDNEGFIPEPPSPPRDRRPSEAEAKVISKLQVQNKFLPEMEDEFEPVSLQPSRRTSIEEIGGVFITVEQEAYQFSGNTGTNTGTIDTTVSQPEQPPPYSPQTNYLPPSGPGNPNPVNTDGRCRTCSCIALSISLVLLLVVGGIAGIAAFIITSADNGKCCNESSSVLVDIINIESKPMISTHKFWTYLVWGISAHSYWVPGPPRWVGRS